MSGVFVLRCGRVEAVMMAGDQGGGVTAAVDSPLIWKGIRVLGIGERGSEMRNAERLNAMIREMELKFFV